MFICYSYYIAVAIIGRVSFFLYRRKVHQSSHSSTTRVMRSIVYTSCRRVRDATSLLRRLFFF